MTERHPITFITGKAEKASQVAKYLEYPVTHHKLDLIEIQNTDPDIVTRYKVEEAYKQLQTPVLVDDNSLEIILMGKLPGTFIKWFEQELGHEGICRLTDTFETRKAVAKVRLGYTDGRETLIFPGNITGEISDHPRGSGGFGWDVIFIPDGYTQTRAEMNEEDYDATSPRRIALEKLAEYLKGK